ncbi:uncharacterized protein DS421_19g654170 [Arachis hypogaea]|uniref:Uncharacterized protein n=1 Tax=Arachis hypogaea TaxID=3818 RepID=A0A6B9VBM5_ARAHY|nr:uncharacterized protein DS421_19g654170 [Arachis hypogaea]
MEVVEAAEAAAAQPPRKYIQSPIAKNPLKKKKNLKRSPPTTQQPPCAQSLPKPPTPIMQPSVRPLPPTTHVPPTVTPQTMQIAPEGTTSRFMDFTPTPAIRGSSSTRWPLPSFHPPARKVSTTAQLNGGSSGKSNSTPNP